MIKVSMVPKDLIHTCWEQIEEYLAGAAEYTYGRYTVDDIKDCITDYDHDLWVAYEHGEFDILFYGAVVTTIVHYPCKKMLSLRFVGGKDHKKWKEPMVSTLKSWAVDTECDGIESTGRPGWAKILGDVGYNPIGVAYELKI